MILGISRWCPSTILADVDEIVFQVETCDESGLLIASWDAPDSHGGITTQGKDLRELQEQVTDAVRCHFDPGDGPKKIRLHFVRCGAGWYPAADC
jgi:hypothetical protein